MWCDRLPFSAAGFARLFHGFSTGKHQSSDCEGMAPRKRPRQRANQVMSMHDPHFGVAASGCSVADPSSGRFDNGGGAFPANFAGGPVTHHQLGSATAANPPGFPPGPITPVAAAFGPGGHVVQQYAAFLQGFPGIGASAAHQVRAAPLGLPATAGDDIQAHLLQYGCGDVCDTGAAAFLRTPLLSAAHGSREARVAVQSPLPLHTRAVAPAAALGVQLDQVLAPVVGPAGTGNEEAVAAVNAFALNDSERGM